MQGGSYPAENTAAVAIFPVNPDNKLTGFFRFLLYDRMIMMVTIYGSTTGILFIIDMYNL
jgi:hypothetical protein